MSLRVIELDIDDFLSGDTSVTEIALVELPAIETEFIYFSKQKFYRAPDYVAATACRAIKENEKRGNPAATQTGKVRAQQLCNQDEITLETVKRMKSYLERAATYYTGDYDDNGTISYDLWGGEEGLKWVDTILERVEREEMDLDVSGLPPYVNYATGDTENNMLIEEVLFIKVNPGETKDDYLQRCMGSDLLISEYPDERQRYAVCNSDWERRDEFSDCGCNKKQSFELEGYIDGVPYFTSPDEAVEYGKETYGCDGYHEHTDEDGNVVYMSCTTHDETMDNGVELEELLEMGWEIESAIPMSEAMMTDKFSKMVSDTTEEKFYTIVAKPNEESTLDYMGKKVRFIYSTGIRRNGGGAIVPTSRMFCRRMLGGRQFVFRLEDILGLNAQITGEDSARKIIPRPKGTSPDILTWKGGANCEHYWTELTFSNPNPDEAYTAKITNQPNLESRKAALVVPAAGQSGQVNPQADPARGARDTFSTGAARLIMVDVDGTLFNGTRPNQNAIDWVNEKYKGYRIVILTGRPESQRRSTEAELAKYGVKYDRLVLSDRSTNQAPEFKRDFVKGLLDERVPVSYVVDDNATTLKYMRELGVNTLAPTQLEQTAVPVGYLQGLPIFDDVQDASDFSYQMGCGGITEELEYMGRKRFQACKYGIDKQESQFSFKTLDEKRMVYSPVMVPNILIPRIDEYTGERYFVKFSPESIEKIQRKFMIEKRLDKTNLEHTDKKFQDIVMVESWLVEGDQDKAFQLGFERNDIPNGTWFVGYKVLDTPEGDKIWNDYIKKGKVRGLSAEGNFLMKFHRVSQDEYLLERIINILKQINQ